MAAAYVQFAARGQPNQTDGFTTTATITTIFCTCDTWLNDATSVKIQGDRKET
jgi:hypothetical protein